MHVAVLAEMVTKILALVTAFDEVSANQEAMQDAALQFDGLLQVSHFLCYKQHSVSSLTTLSLDCASSWGVIQCRLQA